MQIFLLDHIRPGLPEPVLETPGACWVSGRLTGGPETFQLLLGLLDPVVQSPENASNFF